jgi:hypothetical protein
MGAKKDNFIAAAEEDEEEEEPEISNYRVTPEELQAAAALLRIPPEAKLIGDKQIRVLGLMSGGHECKFLEEAGSSFAIPHEEEYFGKLSSDDLITACDDLSRENFVASRCLARRLEREDKEAKESSAVVATSLQNRVAELERRLAAEKEQRQQLMRAKEDEAKAPMPPQKHCALTWRNFPAQGRTLSVF